MNVKQNIKNLEEKLLQLNSMTNLKPELDNDIEKLESIRQSFTNNQHSIQESFQHLSLNNANQIPDNYQEDEISIQPQKMKNSSFIDQKIENYEYNNEIEKFIEENERLKEILREKDMKIETLNFRCEKLQSELTQKLNHINKLTLQENELSSQNGLLTQQRDYLETLVEENKNNLLPEHQKLKSKYDICVLEIKSLENDNKILENKLKTYVGINKNLKMENREINLKNSKMEIEKLEIKRDIEIIKSTIKKNEDDNKNLNEKNSDIKVENERLKNQLVILKKKLRVFSNNKNFMSSYNIGNFDKLNEVTIQIPEKDMKKSFRDELIKKSRSYKSKNDDDNLNFDDLKYFEKKIHKYTNNN